MMFSWMRVDSDAALWVETQSAARIRSKVDCVFEIYEYMNIYMNI